MELIYIWINRSKNGFITSQGFNFYGGHQFTLQIAPDAHQYTLSYKDMSPQVGSTLYDNGCIRNITALVGENGSGKTTLLKCIYANQCLPRHNGDKPGYEKMYEEEYETDKKILVYRFGKNMEIYHNLEPDKLNNKTPFSAHSMNEVEFDKREQLLNILEQQTIIYLSNSMYTSDFNGYQTHGMVNKISLTADSLKTIAGNFYRKTVQYPRGLIENNYFNNLQALLIKNKSVQDFQQICDILYYHNLCSNRLETSYVSKVCKDLYVNFKSVIRLIEKIDGYTNIAQDGIKSDNLNIVRLSEKAKEFLRWCSNIPIEIRRNACATLYLNLIFEMYYCWDNITIEKFYINALSDFTATIETIIECYKTQPENNPEQAAYYTNGFHEINEMLEILQECEKIYSDVPVEDLAHRFDKVVSYNSNRQTYLRFCSFIDSLTRSNSSVLLKYINIDNLYMSSGERAYQNFFSWLNLLPFFDEFIEGQSIRIRDSILLLIDEIDLYMHPEWQRKSVAILFDELSRQYLGKEIQIIISTHSPLVLSDIPKQNTIYLRAQNRKCNLVDNESRSQTFGTNIHTLLNDAFFMRSTMGEYAQEKIKRASVSLRVIR